MAGRHYLLIFSAASIAAVHCFAETPQAGSPSDRIKREGWHRGERKHGDRGGHSSPEFDNVRKAIDALTPEQRKRFQENFVRWMNLSSDDKRALRDREEMRRKHMAEEIDRALRETGLQLDDDRRAQFARRYAEERRKVEEQLRQEMEEKRRPLVREIIGKLKEEFSSSAPAPQP